MKTCRRCQVEYAPCGEFCNPCAIEAEREGFRNWKGRTPPKGRGVLKCHACGGKIRDHKVMQPCAGMVGR